ncbi:CCXG family PEP-CTERM protein [Nitrosomonas oligotropha]|uniref:CCXG family PEP-CTERM protein n=1 Tax=Nitrosomonas oligotropha TaxID=42354 RepID=UPI001367E470|nr:CCXG family PEP-CTERM protein [Nitrosomonas oligotropha]MXS84332.1 PEP-CTERM sorting domain-containing protein [Nitrosomonas oligotropha]
MKITFTLSVTAISLALFGGANASSITIETGFSTAGPQIDAAAYQSIVDSAVAIPSMGYGIATPPIYDNISNHGLFAGGSTTDIAFKSTVDFFVSPANAGAWQIRAGVDFGHGGAIFVDGLAYDFKTNDMWWNGSYSDSSQYLSINTLNLATGYHTLNLYGLEGCCDGSQQAQFRIGGTGDFTTFSTNDSLSPVPEPETYTMLLAGLGLMGFVAHRRKESTV